ncbi:copper resistance system multicopper oxidase [Albimonas sp. CAU 1670]|uniref:copper resistance system multicopper oxidase n=1 Tax=Albimonas sp. CAU 1670 TaxID=3032599 RepID=UPI0023DC6F72|nr:copper resistance system multicopper oxidase [Albimonas sp. CAU 1670]MDF2233787.1 copper resistance system multicopper oxidase [Albimonas sp. CAU 1670]
MRFNATLRVLALAPALGLPAVAALAGDYALTIDPVRVETADFSRSGVGFNGSTEPTVLRFKEGEEVTIRVTNNLAESSSVHWHGIILPPDQDGVPGISFPGIEPGETFTYRFPIEQAGTYWFHSHSHFQEPDGAYGAIVIEPRAPETYRYDRDYVVQVADAHPHRGERIWRNLKASPDYYNREQRTLFDLLSDASEKGLGTALADRAAWGDMRMMPTDVEDVQGFTPVINGKDSAANWTGVFERGERVRLRLINSSAMTFFDVRIPGLKMTVVAADGQDVQPVTVDELRIAVAETYDVIVRPTRAEAYPILFESMGRSAMVRGTLAPAELVGTAPEIPELRSSPLLTMADMGMMHGMDHGDMGHGDMAGMDHGSHTMPDGSTMAGAAHDENAQSGAEKAMGDMTDGTMAGGGAGHVMPDGSTMAGDSHAGHAMPAGAHRMPDGTMMGGDAHASDPFYAPGSGLTPSAADGGKFLSYADLKAAAPLYPDREATREVELRLTGNMERYMWSINGVKYEDAPPLRLQYGERVRFKFVNETMMTHPMHLHGMWTILDNGSGQYDPVKHTVSIAPGTTVYTETEVDAPGEWAFHCHLSYHMEGGMFRKVIVEGGPQAASAPAAPAPAHSHGG